MSDNDFMTGFVAGQSDGNGNKNGDGMFGDGGWIFLILIFALIGGNGFGGFGGGNGATAGALTRADLCDGFNFNQVENGIRGVQNGICDSTYALNTTMMNGFHGTDMQICGVNHNIDNCCCETNRNIDSVRYDAAKNTCDIIQAGHNDTDRVIAFLTNDKIQNLQTDLQSAQLQLSNSAQTTAILNALRPTPIPAYPSCSPYEAYGFGGRGNCGGCNC